MTKETKLSFAEGMAKLSKKYLENKFTEVTENRIEIKQEKKTKQVKINLADFIWISKYKQPIKINFNLQRNELWECFTIEYYSFNAANTKTRFLLSGLNVRRPWILWKEEWESDKDKFVNLKPILGFSKKETKNSDMAVIQLFKYYVNHIGYKIQVNYIEDSEFISEENILKIIET